jgi:large subunit ribosomal protein L25
MHDETPVLNATTRERVGSRYAKRLRAAGQLPAVVYGHKQEPTPVTLDAREAVRHISKGEKVFSLNIDGKQQYVLLKDLGYDYLGTNIVHADFARVDLNERVDTHAHLKFVGEPIGMKKAGAVLVHPVNEISLNCLVTNIPEHIEVDISGLDVGDMLQASQIKLPISTMKLLTEPSTVVVQVIMLKEDAAPATGEAATVDATGKPAVAADKKKDEK